MLVGRPGLQLQQAGRGFLLPAEDQLRGLRLRGPVIRVGLQDDAMPFCHVSSM